MTSVIILTYLRLRICTESLALFLLLADMVDRERVQSVLAKVHPTLRKHLMIDTEFLRQLEAGHVLTTEEQETAETIKVHAQRGDHVIDILKRRPFTHFSSFLKILKKHDEDLYSQCTRIMEGLPGELRFSFEVLPSDRQVCVV